MRRARLEQLHETLAELDRRKRHNRLAHYRPYPKQAEFHAGGATFRERMLSGGNQVGKTVAGGAEAAMHATGRYPDWWRGRRFDRPTVGLVGGVTGDLVREGPQRVLCGTPGEAEALGTGMLPKDCILDQTPARGVADLLDSVTVRHASGGVSRVLFKSYQAGRKAWQAQTADWGWFDEEAPPDVYSEALTRTNVTKGPVFTTFTPLEGMSLVAARFFRDNDGQRHLTILALKDAGHYTAEDIAAIAATYPAHERRARIDGLPMLGSGAVFPVLEDAIAVEPFQIPAWWPVLGGLDFGWDHPFAAVKLAWDRDADAVYVTNAYRQREATPTIHVAALLPWGRHLRWAWPHDGLQHDKGSGDQLATQYRKAGLKMLADRATFPDGSNGVEAGIMEMLARMETGRWKVFANLEPWFEEYRTYQRKDGKLVKLGDDLMSASRYAAMMLRFARPLTPDDAEEGPRVFTPAHDGNPFEW